MPPKKGAGRPKTRRGDAASRIYEGLRSQILTMTLPPGASIDETAIIREFQVSRTPIREAIVRLASEGLIVLLPNKGSQVAPLDLARVRNYLEAMDLIQPTVTAFAADRRLESDITSIKAAATAFDAAAEVIDHGAMVIRNHEFHATIARACGNELLTAAYIRLLDEGLRISPFTISGRYYPHSVTLADFIKSVSEQHWGMVKAIVEQDCRTAEQIAEQHTDDTRKWFSGFITEGFARRKPKNPA